MTAAFLDRYRRAVSEARAAPLELALAEWALRHGGDAPVALAMAACSRAVAEGHGCLPLDDLELAIPGEQNLYSPAQLRDALNCSELVGQSGQARPLIIDLGRLYLHRYWQYEAQLAAGLKRLIDSPVQAADTGQLAAQAGLFDYGGLNADEPHWQAVAAAVALRHRLAVISGGPGTGKTYTVLRLMRLLVETTDQQQQTAPLIRLAAPTGKAAARLVESVQTGLAGMPLAEHLRPHIPQQAQTLHRLVGMGRGTTLPRYHRDNPLAADVVIVDEASMVDLPMMAKLVDALPANTRLILLGDRYQLASVESGSVMAELCHAAGVNAFSADQQQALAPLFAAQTAAPSPSSQVDHLARPLADHVVTLQVSHRFAADSAVGLLAQAVNRGDSAATLALLQGGHKRIELAERTDANVLDALVEDSVGHFRTLLDMTDPARALAFLEQRGLLCALRVGPAGSMELNRRITEKLIRTTGIGAHQRWYHGRPIIVLRNDYRAGLFNGDTGICLNDGNGQLKVWFHIDGALRAFLPTSLPEHDSVYAMTVHKSQGSEFANVTLLLPAEDNPVVSRELLYTGITRARDSVRLLASKSVLEAAVARRTRRFSGLAQRLQDSG